jgi:DNA-binding NarL/FixJ family response regulator
MTTIAVIDDHPIVREGLARVVSESQEYVLQGTFDSVVAYLHAGCVADLVLLDFHLSRGPTGPEAVSLLVGNGSVVLMVSADIERSSVVETLAAGARGYVTKHAPIDELLDAIRIVTDPTNPGTYVSPTLATVLLEASKGNGHDRLDLTNRETEVLVLVAEGERDQDIAELLHISIGTVRSHLDHIRTKTGHRRRAELTRYAIDQNLT